MCCKAFIYIQADVSRYDQLTTHSRNASTRVVCAHATRKTSYMYVILLTCVGNHQDYQAEHGALNRILATRHNVAMFL